MGIGGRTFLLPREAHGWIGGGAADQDRRAGALFHVFVWGWPGQKWLRESCWYPKQRLLLGIVRAAAAKEVTRHLGGELATFSWDPPGRRAVSTDRDQRCFPLLRRQNRGTGTCPHHAPCYFGPLSPGAPSSVSSLAYFLSFTPLSSCSSVPAPQPAFHPEPRCPAG